MTGTSIAAPSEELHVDQSRKIEVIARTVHEVNRIYCETNGDWSQVTWERAPEWQRDSARSGVQSALEGCSPEQLHERWMAEKVKDGWKYGLVKDPLKKTHPCIVPYIELPEHQQAKDHLFRSVVAAMAAALEHGKTLTVAPSTR